MIRKLSIALFFLSMVSLTASANNVQIGRSIPAVTVEKGGEIFVQNDDFNYLPWNTELLFGKVRVIQAIAGRSGAKDHECSSNGSDHPCKVPRR